MAVCNRCSYERVATAHALSIHDWVGASHHCEPQGLDRFPVTAPGRGRHIYRVLLRPAGHVGPDGQRVGPWLICCDYMGIRGGAPLYPSHDFLFGLRPYRAALLQHARHHEELDGGPAHRGKCSHGGLVAVRDHEAGEHSRFD